MIDVFELTPLGCELTEEALDVEQNAEQSMAAMSPRKVDLRQRTLTWLFYNF
jgi:hypothetical protein